MATCPHCDTNLPYDVYRAYVAAYVTGVETPFHRLLSTLGAEVRVLTNRSAHFKNAFRAAYGFEPYHLVDAVRHQQERHSTRANNRMNTSDTESLGSVIH